ncbi:MAG: hydroxyisourate hydrolase [Xanthomonadales bacterium]|nr:hydroxyisourate hydrolase [Xanthomonadales bacterium]
MSQSNTQSTTNITTHVLDTAKGCPAADITVKLEFFSTQDRWQLLATGKTNADGRIMEWMDAPTKAGKYRLSFDTGSYHQGKGFFPSVIIEFQIDATDTHYHVPLLLSPFSYSTYRGS